jgi:hypothetical protein
MWPEYLEDSVPAVVNIGPASPTGIVFGYGTKFPAKYQRALYACDWTFATIHAIHLQPHGASYRAEVEEFVGGTGLPVTDIVVGKDGAVYFAVGGRELGSAIYRVRYVGEEDVAPAAATGNGFTQNAPFTRRELSRCTARRHRDREKSGRTGSPGPPFASPVSRKRSQLPRGGAGTGQQISKRP